MKIIVNLSSTEFKLNFKHNGREFDAFQIRDSSRSAVYIRAFKDGIPMTRIQKRIQIDNDGNPYISFGKEKVIVGTCDKV